MTIRSNPSPRSSVTRSAERILLFFGYLAAWVTVPLLTLWPAGDPNPQATAMFMAAQQGNVAGIDEALRGGVNVDLRDQTDVTPLMVAARTGHLEAVRKLLAAGASIDARGPVFGTPLTFAVMSGEYEIMRELIRRGANVDAVSSTGHTALWFARHAKDEEAVRILIDGGAAAEGKAIAPGTGKTIKRGAEIRPPGRTREMRDRRDSHAPAHPPLSTLAAGANRD